MPDPISAPKQGQPQLPVPDQPDAPAIDPPKITEQTLIDAGIIKDRSLRQPIDFRIGEDRFELFDPKKYLAGTEPPAFQLSSSDIEKMKFVHKTVQDLAARGKFDQAFDRLVKGLPVFRDWMAQTPGLEQAAGADPALRKILVSDMLGGRLDIERALNEHRQELGAAGQTLYRAMGARQVARELAAQGKPEEAYAHLKSEDEFFAATIRSAGGLEEVLGKDEALRDLLASRWSEGKSDLGQVIADNHEKLGPESKGWVEDFSETQAGPGGGVWGALAPVLKKGRGSIDHLGGALKNLTDRLVGDVLTPEKLTEMKRGLDQIYDAAYGRHLEISSNVEDIRRQLANKGLAPKARASLERRLGDLTEEAAGNALAMQSIVAKRQMLESPKLTELKKTPKVAVLKGLFRLVDVALGFADSKVARKMGVPESLLASVNSSFGGTLIMDKLLKPSGKAIGVDFAINALSCLAQLYPEEFGGEVGAEILKVAGEGTPSAFVGDLLSSSTDGLMALILRSPQAYFAGGDPAEPLRQWRDRNIAGKFGAPLQGYSMAIALPFFGWSEFNNHLHKLRASGELSNWAQYGMKMGEEIGEKGLERYLQDRMPKEPVIFTPFGAFENLAPQSIEDLRDKNEPPMA
ncbi:MAG: hypothetical protein HYV63_33745 [Candidatus Schekmanbacteria bacterium]|nr:hypothetical protein [Candidatus Schekmanbacteria bacterium]